MTFGSPSAFFRAAVVYGIFGMLLGIHMAASENHGQYPTHAHLLLIGWVTLFLYGAFLKLHPSVGGWQPSALWWIANVGTVVAVTGLYILYGGNIPLGAPLATVGAITVLTSMVFFATIVWRTRG